jgi:two-component system response regulator YesN
VGLVKIPAYFQTASELGTIETRFREVSALAETEHISVKAMMNLIRNIAVVLNTADLSPEKCERFMGGLVSSVSKKTNTTLYASLSDTATGILSLTACYSQAVEAMKHSIRCQPGSVICYRRIKDKQKDLIVPNGELAKMEEALAKRDEKKAGTFVDLWLSAENIQKYSLESIGQLYRHILRKLDEAAYPGAAHFSENLYRDFYSFDSSDDLKFHIKDCILKTVGILYVTHQREGRVVEVVKQYVQENYEKNIKLTDVAELVSMNYTYLSNLFSERNGSSFSKYLTDVRMAVAKKLLLDPRNRIAEIACKVGYNDAKIFSRAFKNYFGYPPTNFKSC